MKTSYKTDLEVLKEAREKIAKGWTQRTFARNEFGEPVAWDDDGACSFCTVGAIRSCMSEIAHSFAFSERSYVLETWVAKAARQSAGVVCWNDYHYRTQAEILEAFDTAISNLERASA